MIIFLIIITLTDNNYNTPTHSTFKNIIAINSKKKITLTILSMWCNLVTIDNNNNVVVLALVNLEDTEDDTSTCSVLKIPSLLRV